VNAAATRAMRVSRGQRRARSRAKRATEGWRAREMVAATSDR
jgi:hypothetical protein